MIGVSGTGRGPAQESPRIAVLLATFNGASYLDEQITSLAEQDVAHLDILASDDGSTDSTISILEDWQRRWVKGSFIIASGPRLGFAENFRGLIRHSGVRADYVAFCDQDDVWDRDKLSASVRALEQESGPALYGGRTRLVDEQLRPLGLSPLFRRTPHFRNAIVQSFAGGNTMLLNRAAFDLVKESNRRTGFVSHDWWCYLIISGAGGRVIYDPVPRVAYRQHEQNVVGDNSSMVARIRRLSLLLKGQLRQWSDVHLAGLDACSDLLTEAARTTAEQFKVIRGVGGLKGLCLLHRSGIYRQLFGGRITLALAVLLRKV